MAQPSNVPGSPIPKALAAPTASSGTTGAAVPSTPHTPLTHQPANASAAPIETTTPRSSTAVSLHEAALDSPSFRASAVLFSEQVDGIERWLESYTKSTSKLMHDFTGLEDTINNYLARIVPPPGVVDGVIDADHTLLALKRVSDGSRDWWAQVSHALRRFDSVHTEPIRNFLHGELRAFKETRRSLELAQKTYDTTLARYVSQSKTKEPSSLREDAFALFEARRAYLKVSMDFYLIAPQLRTGLDKLLTRVSAEFWRDMKRTRDTAGSSASWGEEMDRIRGWAKDVELSEAPLKRELQLLRREISETTLAAIRPSRELEDYSASTVPFLGSRGPPPGGMASSLASGAVISEKQGWLFLRTVTGKPARVNWVHRWFYCRDGIFGYLVQGPQGVLQGDDIGVLLCSAKPAVQEDRRFCFEVKTKSQNLMLQAETQGQLTEWLEVFEVAKRKAFEASVARDNSMIPFGGIDPAFSITPPCLAEFSATSLDSTHPSSADDTGGNGTGSGGGGSGGGGGGGTGSNSGPGLSLSQSGTLPVPGGGPDVSLIGRSSVDVAAMPPRRSITALGQELRREEGESGREHATRIIQKFDLHRKANVVSGSGETLSKDSSGLGSSNGGTSAAILGQQPPGIASLISASHNLLPGYPSGASQLSPQKRMPDGRRTAFGEPHHKLLAPTTFTKPPLVTFLSRVAVNASTERVLCRPNHFGSLSSGILANYWGSQQWGNSFASKGQRFTQELAGFDTSEVAIVNTPASPTMGTPASAHRKTVSVDTAKLVDTRGGANQPAPITFPPDYPPELRAQHAQFRLLFPAVPLAETLVLVFNAAWSSASEAGTANQGLVGSGRIYVTPDNMYFYSQSMGLVVAYAVSLDIITEVTAAPGKDCDYIFLHLSQDMNETGFTRITIKTFLEDMELLQARLNLLIDDLQAAEPMGVSDILATLQNIASEQEQGRKSPSLASWDQLSLASPVDEHGSPAYLARHASGGGHRPFSAHSNQGGHVLHAEHTGRRITGTGSRGLLGHNGVTRPLGKLQLPAHPVVYEPDDMQKKVAERHFEISAKACFHVLFGDKSFIFSKLYLDRQAREIEQGPWTVGEHGKRKRYFTFKVEAVDMLGRKKEETVTDQQTIDIFSDHVTYVVQHTKTAWHLPHSAVFKKVTKIVITHVAKSSCKLAVYVKVDWSKAPAFSKSLVERQALDDASRDAEELAELATDQVHKLGAHSRTKRAIQVYGNIGQQTKAVQFTPANKDGSGKGDKQAGILKPRTLTDMLLETVRSFMESVVTSLVMWIFAGCRSVFRAATAHRLLLAFLVLSMATNLLFSSRETAAWWAERHATSYMRKLGVGPDVVMSKAIHLVDLEAAAAAQRQSYGSFPSDDEPLKDDGGETGDDLCYRAFLAVANASSLDAPYQQADSVLSSPANQATARRLRRTRQRLGAFRHDLVVAMRVVNSVEREMVQLEWENWLAGETLRCEQAAAMLADRTLQSKSKSKKLHGGERGAPPEAEGKGDGSQHEAGNLARLAWLVRWQQDYCGSCRTDLEELESQEWRQSMI
ncbi:SNF1-interacting protein [Sporothrix epigloea]|uniref:SNF1-interacting protein n=1 Tax=Sporothrix epigloea TaxID=1892477 RepID=A0ABP0DDX0_9PEZI